MAQASSASFAPPRRYWPLVLRDRSEIPSLMQFTVSGEVPLERTVSSSLDLVRVKAKLGLLVEMRVAGLRPAPPPGRFYLAQAGREQ